MEPLEESSLVGLAILSAQKLEFAFYGIIAHVSKENESKQTRPFKGLTPESFLRGDIKELRATFGQLNYHFGDLFLLNNEEFELFIKDRNIIAHNYWRLTKAKIRDGQTLENPKEFLLGFIERCQYWEKIFKGLLWIFQSALAIKFKREDEFVLNAEQELEIQFYYQHAEKFQQEKKANDNSEPEAQPKT